MMAAIVAELALMASGPFSPNLLRAFLIAPGVVALVFVYDGGAVL